MVTGTLALKAPAWRSHSPHPLNSTDQSKLCDYLYAQGLGKYSLALCPEELGNTNDGHTIQSVPDAALGLALCQFWTQT